MSHVPKKKKEREKRERERERHYEKRQRVEKRLKTKKSARRITMPAKMITYRFFKLEAFFAD